MQNRAGNKAGGGGILSQAERNVDRRERMRLLALELSDLNKDPYLLRNNIGTYECRLCLTIHNTEGDYLAHTQAKKHQTNLARRNKKQGILDKESFPIKPKDLEDSIKIGKPGYQITKIHNPETKQNSLLIKIEYPEIRDYISPKFRVLSSFEQNVEPKNKNFQYIVIAAEPYENIAIKIPNYAIDFSDGKHLNQWNNDDKIYTLLFTFLNKS